MAASNKTINIKVEPDESGKTSIATSSINATSTPETRHTDRDARAYLLSNIRVCKKEKSADKSSSLEPRGISVNDPIVNNETYIKAKSEGDFSEASKCFATMFNDLFLNKDQSPTKHQTSELLSVSSQMKEEVRILLNELSLKYLKLNSIPVPSALTIFQASSHNSTPMMSPKLRLSPEDRVGSRDSVARLDTHLHSLSKKSIFYQQLFENLPEETKKSILEHSIETTDNLFDKCRLMILIISIFEDTCHTYGERLLGDLIQMSKSDLTTHEQRQLPCVNQASTMCQYAKSLLLLDAIPLVLNTHSGGVTEVDLEELYKIGLKYYSEHCLEISASEYEACELHEGFKKSLESKAQASCHNSTTDEVVEKILLTTLQSLNKRFLSMNDVDDEEFKKLELLCGHDESITSERIAEIDTKLLSDIMKKQDLEDDIPDEILFNNVEETSNSQPVTTPPPKSRGRPKKGQQSVIVNVDDALKKGLHSKSRKIRFVFYNVVQYFFRKCALHLRDTRGKILMNFRNPLPEQLEAEFLRGTNQRSSRSKSNNSQASESTSNPQKKQKLELHPTKHQNEAHMEEDPKDEIVSSVDKQTFIPNLWSAHLCFEFLSSNSDSLTKLWNRFCSSGNTLELNWFRRFSIDRMMMLDQHEKVSELLEIVLDTKKKDLEIKKEPSLNGISTLTMVAGTRAISVMELRHLTQLVSCNVQKSDKTKTFDRIDELINKIRQNNLLADEESYTTDDILSPYKIIEENKSLGFLYFDAPALIRYCIDLFMDILEKFASSSSIISDSSVGHTIVMSQFDWPKRWTLYEQCMLWLRTHKPKSTTPQCLSAATKFTYPEFFQYIHNPNIIEDFMAMLCQGYTLDIKGFSNNHDIISNSQTRAANGNQALTANGRGSSSGSTTRSGKAITTRGVNKSFKEDLKVALIAQMKCSTLLIPLDMVCEFLQSSLIPFLSVVKK